MNAFDPLLWTGIACLVVQIAKTGREPLVDFCGRAGGRHDSEQVRRGVLAGGVGCWRVPDAAAGRACGIAGSGWAARWRRRLRCLTFCGSGGISFLFLS